MLYNKPTIYNTPTIYKTGSGGGGDGALSVDVDGVKYNVVKVGNKYFTTENLKNRFGGEIPLTGDYSVVSCRWANNNEAQAIVNKWNLLYSIPCISVIGSHLSDGWRVAKQADYDYLYKGYFINSCSWGINYFGVSLVKNGNSDGNNFFNVGSVANMRIENGMYSIDGSYGRYVGTSTTEQQRFAAIRLCKDVE